MTFDPDAVSWVTGENEVRARHPKMLSRAEFKVLDHLDKHCRAILERSPFCVIATCAPDGFGGVDVSPRGDPPGFLRVLDDMHLLLPDRVGNNRFDNVANLFANPKIGMLVVVPGVAETLRINGTARITDDEDLLRDSAVAGRPPKIGLVIRVKEVFLHCAKALNRAKLWDPGSQIDRRELPTYAQMLADHVPDLTDEENARQSAEMARRGMY
ncbi:MAG: MSMEG_1061 family FMN-dependent PPOX-type flavoprotein [Pseudomonadota bacterium]